MYDQETVVPHLKLGTYWLVQEEDHTFLIKIKRCFRDNGVLNVTGVSGILYGSSWEEGWDPYAGFTTGPRYQTSQRWTSISKEQFECLEHMCRAR